MGIFVQYALASMMLAVALVYMYDHTIGQAVNRVSHTVRVGVFVGAWTALTAFLGLQSVAKGVRTLRQKTKGVATEIAPVPKHREK